MAVVWLTWRQILRYGTLEINTPPSTPASMFCFSCRAPYEYGNWIHLQPEDAADSGRTNWVCPGNAGVESDHPNNEFEAR
jgi:hypothetical protein